MRVASLVSLILLFAGCSSTHQIQTAPPQPATPLVSDTANAVPRSLLTVVVETGETSLPSDIQAMQFRIAEIQLKQAGSTWVSHVADAHSIELVGNRPARKTVLTTRLPAVAYDSLAVALTGVYVQYDANAGGPLTLPRDTPLRLPLSAHLVEGETATLRLVFEPGASLSRDARCRWYFLPFFEARVE